MCRVFQTNGATYSLGEMLHDNIGEGGENLTGEVYSGFVKFIDPNGYGFIECDDEDIDDSILSQSLIQEHDLEANDEVEYSVKARRDKTAVDQIYSVNGKPIDIAPKLDSKRIPKSVTGFISQLTKAGNGVIALDDYSDDVSCDEKIMTKYNLSIDDVVDLSLKPARWGGFDFHVSSVLSINGEVVREKVPQSIAKKISNLFHYNLSKKLTKLFLSFTSGGNNEEIIEMYAGAQESLKPFLDYANKSIEAAENQRNTLRFRWEEIKKPSKITVKPNFTTLSVIIECYEYLTKSKNLELGERFATEEDNTLNRVTKIGNVSADGSTPFSTEFPLEYQDNWQRIKHNLVSLDYKTSTTTPTFTAITSNKTTVNILSQIFLKDHIRVILQGKVSGEENLSFDDKKLSYSVAKEEIFTLLKDKEGHEIINAGQTGTEIQVSSLPSGELLYDQNLLPYTWNQSGKASRRRTIKLTLHEVVQARINLSIDDDPYDWIFSPNREIYNLEVEGKNWSAKQVRVYDRNQNTKTVQVDELPPKGSILTSAPRTRLIRAQRDMLEELMNHSLPHNEALLKLLAPGNLTQREDMWNDNAPKSLTNEPDWIVLTENTDGTETQREMVRIALESRDISILQGPPGSGKSTTILEFVYQSILRGDNILLCGSTQASIDNVLGRIINDSRLSDIISPVRIGDPENIYDVNIKKFTLAEQKKKWMKNFGFDSKEAAEFILSSSNLTCGTMESILGHPWILESRREGIDSRSTDSKVIKSPQPRWDVLIIDESSKTTFNEFIVPAMFCKKFVLVGDIRQLPPFTQEGEFIANLESIRGFDKHDQRAMVLNFQLSKIDKVSNQDQVVMLVEKDATVSRLVEEWKTRSHHNLSLPQQNLTVISSKITQSESSNQFGKIECFAPKELIESEILALKTMCAGILIIDETSLGMIEHMMPPMATILGPKTISGNFSCFDRRTLDYRSHPCFKNHNISYRGSKKIVEAPEWSSEVSWRLARLSELKISESDNTKQRYKKALDKLIPESISIRKDIDLIRLIALPSVMECLQEGFRNDDESVGNIQSTLTHGFPESSFDQVRFKMLDYQHRMETGISQFPRMKFYGGEALKDANTIALRNKQNPFNYRNNNPSALWIVVHGNEEEGSNMKEVKRIERELKEIINWTRGNPPKAGAHWTVAILTPYGNQNFQLLQMVKRITKITNCDFRFDLRNMAESAPIDLVVSSTDKYQGQEADIVLISLVKTSGHGFLDSWNRMNVALTRSKRKRIIFGNHNNFKGTNDEMLNQLANSHTGNSLIKEGE